MRGPKIDWGVILLKPGDKLGPHYHNEVEETFYFLEGRPLIHVNGEEFRATAGDVFMMQAPDRHNIVNDTNEPVKMVFIKSPYLPKDKVDC